MRRERCGSRGDGRRACCSVRRTEHVLLRAEETSAVVVVARTIALARGFMRGPKALRGAHGSPHQTPLEREAARASRSKALQAVALQVG